MVVCLSLRTAKNRRPCLNPLTAGIGIESGWEDGIPLK